MRSLCAALALVVLFGGQPAVAAERIDLKLLYAGCPESERLKDFQSFLEEHFAHVAIADMSKLREEDAAKHDVVIFDWQETLDGRTGRLAEQRRLQNPLRLSDQFDRPAVLIGETGGRVTAFLKLKLDWLCLCLDDAGHHLALDHEVFHKPLEVAPEFEGVETPEDYRFMTLEKLGPKMTVWKAQTKTWPEIDPGLVHGLYGFADSPDCEVFAQGMCMKGPDSVALGRQGNLFHWGFSAKPSDMTPAARRLFVNSLCYIHKFSGNKPVVKKVARGREWALRHAQAPVFMSDEYLQVEERRLRRDLKQHPGWIPEKFSGDAERYIEDHLTRIRQGEEQFFEMSQPAELRLQFGKDAARFTDYYRTNLEYLRPQVGEGREYQFAIDEDVKSLGLSNRKIELLDRCISLLEDNDRSKLALRILERYTNEKFDTASQWRSWLTSVRDRLFFSDVGGYKFFVADAAIQTDNSDRAQSGPKK